MILNMLLTLTLSFECLSSKAEPEIRSLANSSSKLLTLVWSPSFSRYKRHPKQTKNAKRIALIKTLKKLSFSGWFISINIQFFFIIRKIQKNVINKKPLLVKGPFHKLNNPN